MKAIGIRYALQHGITAEVLENGEVVLKYKGASEHYTKQHLLAESTLHGYSLRKMLSCPESSTVFNFVMQHGRPVGTVMK